MNTHARTAGLVDAVMQNADDQVRLVKARLLLSTAPDDVKAILDYSGVQGMVAAAMLLASVDGDVENCKTEILRFWIAREYHGPLVAAPSDLPALLDTL